jgi:DNA-binding phage protein
MLTLSKFCIFIMARKTGAEIFTVRKAMKQKTTYKAFDAAAYLDNDAVIAECLSAAAEDPNPDVFVAALGDVAKARGMARIANELSPKTQALAGRACTKP